MLFIAFGSKISCIIQFINGIPQLAEVEYLFEIAAN
jgi:hypothetical protein